MAARTARCAALVLLLLAGCAPTVPVPVAQKSLRPAIDTAAIPAMMRGATGQAMASFVQLCLGPIGQVRPMRSLLLREGFAPLEADEADRLSAIPGEHWRAPGRPYLMSIIADGLGCGMVMPIAEGEHARSLLQQALRGLQNGGQQLTVIDAAAAGAGQGTEHYQLRPRGAPFYLDIRLNVTVNTLNLPGVVAVVGAVRDGAPPPRRDMPPSGAPLLRT